MSLKDIKEEEEEEEEEEKLRRPKNKEGKMQVNKKEKESKIHIHPASNYRLYNTSGTFLAHLEKGNIMYARGMMDGYIHPSLVLVLILSFSAPIFVLRPHLYPCSFLSIHVFDTPLQPTNPNPCKKDHGNKKKREKGRKMLASYSSPASLAPPYTPISHLYLLTRRPVI